jgi:homoserine kinase
MPEITIDVSATKLFAAACGAGAIGWLLWRSRKEPSVRSSKLVAVHAHSPSKRSRSISLTNLQRQLSQRTSEEKQSVTVQVPATSANMGAGFDTIGMAVEMWNEVTLTRANKFSVTVEGEGADDVPRDESNLVVVGVKTLFEAIGVEMPVMHYHCKNRIPHGRGLGSSSAAIVGGLLAGLAIAGRTLDVRGAEQMLQLGLKLEGHPDNIAPALYGGVQLGIYSERCQRWMTSRVALPHGLIFVIFIPGFTGKTSELRRVVPKTVPIADAVYNMGRLAWMLTSLFTGNHTDIREGFDDRLHQNQRGEAVYPYLRPMIDAAYQAGALGAYLSGSGPCVMAITQGASGDFFTQCDADHRSDGHVAAAMQKVAVQMGVEGKVYITQPAHSGGVVVAANPPFSTPLMVYQGDR